MKAKFTWISIPLLLVLGSMTSVTLGASLAKTLFHLTSASGVTVGRIAVGALLLNLYWRPWKYRLSVSQFKIIFAYGLCLGIMNLLFYYAISRLPIGLAIAIEFLGPLSIALLYSKKALDLLWAFLAAIGIFLISPLADFSGTVDWHGILFASGAGVAWAIYIVIGKKASLGVPAGAATAFGMTVAFFAIVPFGAGAVAPLLSDSKSFWTMLGVGFFSTALPYSLEMVALKKISEKHFGILMSLEPAIGALIAFFFLTESLTILQCLAIAFIIAASVGSSVFHSSSVVEPTPQ